MQRRAQRREFQIIIAVYSRNFNDLNPSAFFLFHRCHKSSLLGRSQLTDAVSTNRVRSHPQRRNETPGFLATEQRRVAEPKRDKMLHKTVSERVRPRERDRQETICCCLLSAEFRAMADGDGISRGSGKEMDICVPLTANLETNKGQRM